MNEKAEFVPVVLKLGGMRVGRVDRGVWFADFMDEGFEGLEHCLIRMIGMICVVLYFDLMN